MLPSDRACLLALSFALLLFACRLGPGALDVGPAGAQRPDRALRLRIYVSGSYASQAIGTHPHLRALVRDADRLFFSAVGAHLVIEEIVDGWKVDVGRSRDALTALVDADPGGDIDVVVGVLGPSAERQDGCGGMAEMGGSHMVIRTEDTDGSGDHASAVITFLHELGHVLGAPHDDRPGSIMNASDVSTSATFGEASIHFIQSGLARRGISPSTAFASYEVAAPHRDPLGALTMAERAAFEQALEAERRGDFMVAWQKAAPLAVRYPFVLDVQDLRCRLARARDLPWSEVRAECEALMQLMTSTKPLE
jgi:hypothetical protein